MRRIMALTMMAGLLALSLVLTPEGILAESDASAALERAMVANADTPAEHQALAAYYRARASEARAVAGSHRDMANGYATRGGKVTFGKVKKAQDMKKHCDRIADLNEELAAQYDELALGEDAAAM